MNFKNEIRSNIILFGVIIIFLVTVGYLFQETFLYGMEGLLNNRVNDLKSEIRDCDKQVEPVSNRLLSFNRLSPDKSLELLYYSEHKYDQQIIAVQDKRSGREEAVYSGKRINYPKWLGNEHVFFTTYCGSGCQGFILVNVRSKEVRTGVLEFISFEADRADYTRFSGWFGQEFEFDGLPKKITGEIQRDQAGLVFTMEDRDNRPLGQKKFLFNGDKLVER